MDIKLISFLGFIALVTSKDIGERLTGLVGEKIYDEKKEASPAIWVQDHNVTVSANDTEVITRVAVTDLRPAKDGEAKIVEGGVGKNNVTIELKSPAVFRGFDFHVEVYAVPMEEYVNSQEKTVVYTNNTDDKREKTTSPTQVKVTERTGNENVKIPPADLSTEIKVDKRGTTQESKLTTLTVSTTTKYLQIPTFIAKNDEDYGDKQPTVPLVKPTLMPIVAFKDVAKSDKEESSVQESSTPFSYERTTAEISPNNGFTTLAKNVNVDAKTTQNTPQGARKYRDTDELKTIVPKTNSTTDTAEVKTNASIDTKAQEKAYPNRENFTPFSEDSEQANIAPNNGFTSIKNMNPDTKTTESVISSRTTQAPRISREVYDTGKLVGTPLKIDSATNKVEVKSNGSDIKVQDMKPYPMLKKDCDKGNGDAKRLCQ